MVTSLVIHNLLVATHSKIMDSYTNCMPRLKTIWKRIRIQCVFASIHELN